MPRDDLRFRCCDLKNHARKKSNTKSPPRDIHARRRRNDARNVSAAKKIVHDAEKVAQTRVKIDFVKRHMLQ
jgi:hypothetical protein